MKKDVSPRLLAGATTEPGRAEQGGRRSLPRTLMRRNTYEPVIQRQIIESRKASE